MIQHGVNDTYIGEMDILDMIQDFEMMLQNGGIFDKHFKRNESRRKLQYA